MGDVTSKLAWDDWERGWSYPTIILDRTNVFFEHPGPNHFMFVQSQDSEHWQQLVEVVDFALALRDKLESINQECFNQFVLRVGE